MDFQTALNTLKEQMGDKFDKAKAEAVLKGIDLKENAADVMAKVKARLADLDGDGKQEGLLEEVKGKVSSMFGGKK